MTSENWRRIEDLFKETLEKSPAERAAYLTSIRFTDPELVAEVRRLLHAEEHAGDFIEQAISDGATLLEEEESAAEDRAGMAIGPYRLMSELGRGGMSLVYRAVRVDASFQREVAVKLIRRGMDTEETRRRFHVERQILARLDHPNIARVYDGGTTADGLPYFVMEYIEGQPIDTWCDRQRLSINKRLDLFIKVCRAVHYAQRNLIVHRDLKPSNVLVSREGEPKLLDFGIAKLLNGSPSGNRTGPFLPMTPAFASPEQVRGEPVTTATDVYSLGVLLYLLLTGHKPYQLDDDNPRQLLKTVCETDPPRPSVAVKRVLGATESAGMCSPEELSRLRSSQPDQLCRRLRGDLDNIVLRALCKEPERRYGSAGELAEDLERFREGRPVRARRQTLGYVGRKYLSRHWLGSAVTAIIAGLLLALTLSTYRISSRTARERDRAEQVSALLVDLFEITEPDEARGNAITGRELLDRGAAKVRKDLADHPETQTMLLATLGQLYAKMGIYDQAEQVYRDALTLEERMQPSPADYPSHVRSLGVVLAMKGDFIGAEKMFRQSLALNLARFGEMHDAVARDLNNLALANHDLGRYEAAATLYYRAVALGDRLYGPNHPGTTVSRSNLALLLYDSARYAEAEQVLRNVLLAQARRQPNDRERIVETQKLLGMTLQARGDLAGARATLRQALTDCIQINGGDHREVAAVMNNLGAVLRESGSLGEAEVLLRNALTMRRRHLGETHAELASSLEELAALNMDCGDYDEAARFYNRALDNYEANFTGVHPLMGRPLAGLGLAYYQMGHLEIAGEFLVAGLALLPPNHWQVAESESALAGCLLQQNQFAEARALLESSRYATAIRLGESHPRTRAFATLLAQLPDGLNQP